MTSLDINGKVSKASTPVDYSEGLLVNAKCFDGILGLDTCKATNLDQQNAIFDDLPYYYNFNTRGNQPYCVQCCGNNPNRVDTWALSCTMSPVTAALSNMFGYEFRFTKRELSPSDSSTIIRCPIWRSECSYFSNGTVSFCPTPHQKYLIGYTLTLYVREHDVNFQYWRGVDSCSVTTFESNTSIANQGKFSEEILLVYNNTNNYTIDDSRLALIALFAVIFVIVGLYFIRKQVCIVCQRKLVICVDRCFTCRILGADTDRELVNMLREKGAILQGTSGSVNLPQVTNRSIKSRIGISKIVPVTQNDAQEKSDVDGGKISIEKSFISTIIRRLNFPWWRGSSDEEEQMSAMTYRIKNIDRRVVLKAVGHPNATLE